MTGTRGQLGAPLDLPGRVSRVQARLLADHLDALVVTRLPNVRYLTGFTGSAGTVMLTPDRLVFVTDGRYAEQAVEQLTATGIAPDATISIASTTAAQREVLVGALGAADRVGLEAHGVTWAQQRRFAQWLEVADSGREQARELVPTESLVEDFRAVKEPGEVDRIRAACATADAALEATLPLLHAAPTERAFALALELAMRERGASGTSFDTIIASGPNGAKPHARPTDRTIEREELVVIDFGCIVEGYCSDMTRTVSVGDPGPDAQRLWDVVAQSQRAGRDAVRDGVAARAVDAASRDVIEAAGWGEQFSHGTGHGVGLEIHEAPRLGTTADATLESGHVVTVEPGVYLPGIGGVRIEDTVVVTGTGADPLTEFPKMLVV